MNGVQKTLYIPLYGKAYVSRKGVILRDKKAEEIWQKEAFPLNGKAKSKYLAYYMGMRSAVFDRWTANQILAFPKAVVIHIGCGMDSRVLRVDTPARRWYDVDFEPVICERRRYFEESGSYRMLSGDARKADWLAAIPESGHAIVVMEGVSMYMDAAHLKALTAALCAHFEQVSLLMDAYSIFAAKASKFKNPIHAVGASEVYGLNDPALLNHPGFSFAGEHDMTPQVLIDELSGAEKWVFEKLYAGKISRKLYRLYEYHTVR